MSGQAEVQENGWRIVRRGRSRKMWFVIHGSQISMPALRQLRNIFICSITHHSWRRWRRETEEWFEYVDEPLPYAWRICSRCQMTEMVMPDV